MKLALNLASSHLAIAYTQGIELSQHPVIREALLVRGGREAILDPRSVVPIPITLAAQIFVAEHSISVPAQTRCVPLLGI